MHSRARYTLYGMLALVGLGLYATLDDPVPGASSTSVAAGERAAMLPELNAMDDGGSRTAGRDLFAVIVPPPPPPPPAPPKIVAAVVAPPPPPPVDRFREVRVIGMIGRGGVREVVLQVDGEIMTLGSNEPFGPDDALSIESIDPQSVNIIDTLGNLTKTFALYED